MNEPNVNVVLHYQQYGNQPIANQQQQQPPNQPNNQQYHQYPNQPIANPSLITVDCSIDPLYKFFMELHCSSLSKI